MKKVFSWFMVWRSIPAILVYLSLSANIKNQISMDMERLGVNENPNAPAMLG